MGKRRNLRVDHRVREAVADLLEEEIADPRVSLVTVTDVRVSEDHRHATVYYTTLDRDVVTRDPARTGGDELPAAEDAAAGLASAAPRIQGLLARRIRLRHTPQLEFEPDPVAASSRRIDQLLAEVSDDHDEEEGP